MKRFFVIIIFIFLIIFLIGSGVSSFQDVVCDVCGDAVLGIEDSSIFAIVDKDDLSDLMNVFSFEMVGVVRLEDRIILEGYSSFLENFVVCNGQKINLQIMLNDELCVIGYPLIKNSF